MFTFYVSITSVGIVLAWLSLRVVRLKPSTPGPWCAQCGYSLKGVDYWKTCPECGVDLKQVHPHFQSAMQGWSRVAIAGWTLAMILLTFTVERNVMLKCRSGGRHIYFFPNGIRQDGRLSTCRSIHVFQRATDWLIGPDVPMHEWISWRVYEPFEFTSGNKDLRVEFDRQTQVLTLTRADGLITSIKNGLSVEAFETWWTAAGIDTKDAVTKAEMADMVSLLRMRILGEGKYDPDRKTMHMGVHAGRAASKCWTPWYLLVPYLALAVMVWRKGLRRIGHATSA